MSFRIALLLLLQASCTLGHVALTYPRAAYPQYDFLDNVRTGGPCGLAMGQPTSRDTLVANTEVTVTFHLAYAHRGGFAFDLLSCNGTTQLVDLTNGVVPNVSSTTTEWTLTLPSNTCDCCYFRLRREAREWTGPAAWGGRYIFWSCAPVQILLAATDSCDGTNCSGHGTCQGGACTCSGMWYGKYCQYEDACRNDSDCNGHGQCIDLQSTSPPAHQCFCEAGWHGPLCSKKSTLTNAMFNEDDYPGYIKAKDNLEYFYQFDSDNNELEVAIKYSGGEEWVGFGFRPSGTDGSCRATSPGFYPPSASQVTPEGEGEGEGEGETNAEGEGETNAEGEGETTAEGEGETNAEGEGETNAEGEGENNAEGEAGTGSLHAMDCTDMVISKVKGNLHRILDHYTRGRSTPQEDEWYGGQQNIVAAVGQRVDGVTYIRFRKPARSSDKFDHSITNSIVNVIWAHGQVIGQYMPTIPPPAAGVDKSSFKKDFYQAQELKYHGSIGRGSTSTNLVNPASQGTDQCSFQILDSRQTVLYSARWGPSQGDSQKILFELEATSAANTWVGIGFSDNRRMPESDIVTAAISSSNVVRVADRWASMTSRPAVDDDESQVQDWSVNVRNGKIYATFKRTVATSDSMDLSLDQPRYFLFAWGPLRTDGDIIYHGSNKYISDERISATLCAAMSERSSGGGGGDSDVDEIWGIAVAVVVVVLGAILAVVYYIYSRQKFQYTKQCEGEDDQPFGMTQKEKVSV